MTNFKQLGSSGLRRQGGYVYEEFLPRLRWPRAGKIYQEMFDNDPVIGGVFYLAEMLIRGTTWGTRPGGETPRDIEAAEFLKECMYDMDTSWEDTISEILSMMPYGFSFHEVVHKIRRGPNEKNGKYKSKYNDGRIGWRRMPIRSQESLNSWMFDEDGDIKAFVQDPDAGTSLKVIPLSKGLLFRTRVNRDNPEGQSLLRNAYRPWYFKKRIEEIEGIGIERDLAGLPVLTAPEGMDLWDDEDPLMKALRTNAEHLVQSIRRDSEEGILLPNGWELKLLSTGSNRQFDTNTIISRYDHRIALTMLSDIVILGGDKSGSFAMADTKRSILSTALQSQLENISDVFNKYAVPKLMMMNGFDDLTALPKIEASQINTPDIKELSLLLRSMNLDIQGDMELMNYLRKISDMPALDKETFEEVYKDQEKKERNDDLDDTTEKDFEQNDMNHI